MQQRYLGSVSKSVDISPEYGISFNITLPFEGLNTMAARRGTGSGGPWWHCTAGGI